MLEAARQTRLVNSIVPRRETILIPARLGFLALDSRRKPSIFSHAVLHIVQLRHDAISIMAKWGDMAEAAKRW
jgi:hypothetical protein